MEKDLKNKVIVVTGAAQGIGFDIADKYLAENAKTVIILDVNETEGTKAAKTLNLRHGDGKAVFMKCDITKDLEAVSGKIFKEYKQVDVLVNNAGIADESIPRRVLEINALGLIECSMIFWHHMRKDKGGRGGTIVNIGSTYSFCIDPYLPFYTASKFAIMGFTRCLGYKDNYLKFGVRVLVLCPGIAHSKLTHKQVCWDEHVSDFAEFNKTQIWQETIDIAKAAVEVFKKGESGSAWKVIGGVLEEVPLAPGTDLKSLVTP